MNKRREIIRAMERHGQLIGKLWIGCSAVTISGAEFTEIKLIEDFITLHDIAVWLGY